MAITRDFMHYNRGCGRPQVLLLGNGLERSLGQADWDALLEAIKVPGCADVGKAEKEAIPFPLLFEVLTTHLPAGSQINSEAMKENLFYLKKGLSCIHDASNDLLGMLPSLNVDHILTANYSYCTEAGFRVTTFDSKHAGKCQFRCPEGRNPLDAPIELAYRLRTGYLMPRSDGGETAIWHIHGEKNHPQTVVLGHEKYGRVLGRITACCAKSGIPKQADIRAKVHYRNWPELFLYGDIYILGFSCAMCETDIWWLLRRRQKEIGADGKVFFYELPHSSENVDWKCRQLLLNACGVEVLTLDRKPPNSEDDKKEIYSSQDYREFYEDALQDIASRIYISREEVLAASNDVSPSRKV